MNQRHDLFILWREMTQLVSAIWNDTFPVLCSDEKMIRDLIGKRIAGNVNECHAIRIVVNTKEKITYLTQKIVEEIWEFYEAFEKKELVHIRDEAGDVLEVLDSLKKIMPDNLILQLGRRKFIEWLLKQWYNMPSIINAQEEKRRLRWSFDVGYILKK